VDGLPLRRAYYADRGSDYIRQFDDGAIGIGGRRKRFAAAERTTADEVTAALQAELERAAAEMLGVGAGVIADRVVRRWAGTMGFTRDGRPAFGAVGAGGVEAAAFGGRLMFLGGFTGHGMSLGAGGAQAATAWIAEQVLGDAGAARVVRGVCAPAYGLDELCAAMALSRFDEDRASGDRGHARGGARERIGTDGAAAPGASLRS
jgi:hypothetical protein